jgi:NAD(P)-dependent dehydrogenase (short-subunit alcohol dehydrogenase family)
MKNLFDLTHKVALITGASSGMGKAIAEAMGAHGAKVIVSSNDTEGCQSVTQLLDNQGVISLVVPYDTSQKEDIDRLYEKAISSFGKIFCPLCRHSYTKWLFKHK